MTVDTAGVQPCMDLIGFVSLSAGTQSNRLIHCGRTGDDGLIIAQGNRDRVTGVCVCGLLLPDGHIYHRQPQKGL